MFSQGEALFSVSLSYVRVWLCTRGKKFVSLQIVVPYCRVLYTCVASSKLPLVPISLRKADDEEYLVKEACEVYLRVFLQDHLNRVLKDIFCVPAKSNATIP